MSISAKNIMDHKTLWNVYLWTCNVQILQIFGYSDSMAITSSYVQDVRPKDGMRVKITMLRAILYYGPILCRMIKLARI